MDVSKTKKQGSWMYRLLPILSALVMTSTAKSAIRAEDNGNYDDIRQFIQAAPPASDDLNYLTAQFDLLRASLRLIISDERHLPILRHSGQKTEYAALIIHGLYGSPHHMKYIQDQFAQRGINSVSWLLPGHYHKNYQDLDNVSYTDWIASARQGLKWAQKLGKKVILVGFSTGGLINSIFASEPQNNIAGLMVMAPAYKVHSVSFLAAQIGDMTGLVGNDFMFGPPNGKNVSYYSPHAALELERMADAFRAQFPSYSHLQMPILVLGFNDDFTVDPGEANSLAKEAPRVIHYQKIPLGAKSPAWVFSTFEPPVEFSLTPTRMNHGIFPGIAWASSWRDSQTGKTISINQAVSDWMSSVRAYR